MQTISQEKQMKGVVNRLGWTLVIMLGVISASATVDVLINSVLEMLVSEGWVDYRISVAIGAIVSTVCYLAYFLIPARIFYLMSRKSVSQPIKFEIRFSKYLPLMIFSGLAVTQIAGVFNGWFSELIGYELPMDSVEQYMTDSDTVVMYMTVSLAPAFAEEIMFRGVVFTNLRPFGKTIAVLGSAVTFALMHQNVGQFFYTFVAGIVMALIYEATGSIWGGVFLHMFNNLYAVMQTVIMYRYGETTANVILTLSQTVIILVGTISTVWLLAVQKKHIQHSAFTKNIGIFGDSTHESIDGGIPFSGAVKIFTRTPGMLVYIIMSFALAALTVVAVWLTGLAGGI